MMLKYKSDISKTVDETNAAALRIAPLVYKTKIELSAKLSQSLGIRLFYKREDQQLVHSFKIRGAANKVIQLTQQQRQKGVLAASAGNHAQGVALAAEELGIAATIVMPTTTPAIKVDAVRSYQANVILHGDNYSEAYEYSQILLAKSNATFIHPFNDMDVIIGQGTIAKEILDDCTDVSHIFVPVGGGGLLAGISRYVKAVKPSVKIIAVEPDDSNAMQLAFAAGKPVTIPKPPSIFADGVAVKEVGELTYAIAQQYTDDLITVSKDEISAAMADFMIETRHLIEPAGALSIAGAKVYADRYPLEENAVFVTICSGANISPQKLRYALGRSEQYHGLDALFSVELKETPGALYSFCKTIVTNHTITEFRYRLSSRAKAHIFIGFAMTSQADKTQFMKKMKAESYAFDDLSGNDFAKDHLRGMIGGTTTLTRQEHIYQILLPERSGALAEFLEASGSKWNISLFHYRSYGGETGQVIIGFETSEVAQLELLLKKTGYVFMRVNAKTIRHFI